MTISVRSVAGFGLMVGLSATLLMGAFAFSPLMRFFLEHVVTAGDVTPLVVWTMRVLTPLPLIVAAQSLWQGFLIARGATADVRLAIVVNLVATGLVPLTGVAHGRLPGALIGGGAMSGGLLAETVVLWWRARGQA